MRPLLAVTRRHSTKLCLPGGKCDPGEDWATAAVRETQEETGVSVPGDRIAWVHTGPCESYPGGPSDFEVATFLAVWDEAYGPVVQQEPGIEPVWMSVEEWLRHSAMPVYNGQLRLEVDLFLSRRGSSDAEEN